MNRRKFIEKLGLGAMVLTAGSLPLDLLAANNHEDVERIVLLHTNDTHSRIDPFPPGSKYEGLGGMAKRAQLIKQIRNDNEQVLLVDAGDIFQGTPYFNIYGGELEFTLMSQMGYDASTLGNHDFDAGIDGLVKQLPHAQFPFVNCNYNFDDSDLNGKIIPYKIVERGHVKIGLTGVGVELKGLVPDKLFGNVIYNDPVFHAHKMAKWLKEDQKCDIVILLSHLGYKYENKKVSDVVLASQSEYVDIIIGGHTHTFLDKPMVINNLKNMPVVVNQVGWAGINLGQLEIAMNKEKNKNKEKLPPAIFSKKTIVK